MKKLLQGLFAGCTGLLIAASIALPWVVSQQKDRSLEGQVLQYDAVPVQLQSDSGLLSHLQLAADGYSMVELTNATTVLSEAQCQTKALNALQTLADQGLILFDPTLWTPQEASPFMAVATITKIKTIENLSSSTSAAVFWSCILTTQSGEHLKMILDDAEGKLLSFVYTLPDATDSGSIVQIDQSSASMLANFCIEHYHLTVEAPYFLSEPKYFLSLLTLRDRNGNQAVLSFSAIDGSLLFNF